MMLLYIIHFNLKLKSKVDQSDCMKSRIILNIKVWKIFNPLFLCRPELHDFCSKGMLDVAQEDDDDNL